MISNNPQPGQATGSKKIVIIKQEETVVKPAPSKSNIKIINTTAQPNNVSHINTETSTSSISVNTSNTSISTTTTSINPISTMSIGNSGTTQPRPSAGISMISDDPKYENMPDKQKKAYTSLSTKRLQEEEKQVKTAFDKGALKKDEILSFKPIMKNGAKDLYEWELVIKGKPGTLWEGGIYKILLNVPFYFPERPPKVKFLPPPGKDRFNHVHVYGDGRLCLDLIDAKVFRADVSFIAIAEAIYNIIHAPPNISSPANLTLNDSYQNDKAKYESVILEQAKLSAGIPI